MAEFHAPDIQEVDEGPEDGSGHESGEDEGPRIQPRTFQYYRFLSKVVDKIYRIGVCLSQAVGEYYQLPESDQQQVWGDLVGVEGHRRVFVQGKELLTFALQREPDSLVRESLQELTNHIDKMPDTQKEAYGLALQRAPTYVKDPFFRLKFLRAEKFDTKAAAERLTRYFDEKLKLFGEDKLGRELGYEDLDIDDRESLANGYLQILGTLDESNRKIIFYYKAISNVKGTNDCYKQRENILRSFWYVANILSQNEQVQKLGVVNVVYNVGGFPKHGMDYEKSRWLSRLFRAIPIRFNSFYVCLDESAWVTVVETFAVMISRFLRIRLRMIKGTHQVVCEKLKLVGIPAEALPVNERSELLVEDWHTWIEKQKQTEKADKPPPMRWEYLLLYRPNAIAQLMDDTAAHYGRKRPYQMIG